MTNTTTPPKQRYALVELFVKVPERRRNGAPHAKGWKDVIKNTILRAPERRRRAVEAVLDHLELQKVNMILFPGWTLVGKSVPKSVLKRIGDRDVFIELFEASDESDGKGKKAMILRGPQVLVGPLRQLFATAEGALTKTTTLVAQLGATSGKQRRWTMPAARKGALVLCGEVNAIRLSRDPYALTPHDSGLPGALQGVQVIANPSHTRTHRHREMGPKRKWFAAGRTLLTVANCHGRFLYASKGQEKSVTAKSTAQVFAGSTMLNGAALAKLVKPVWVGPHRVLIYEE